MSGSIGDRLKATGRNVVIKGICLVLGLGARRSSGRRRNVHSRSPFPGRTWRSRQPKAPAGLAASEATPSDRLFHCTQAYAGITPGNPCLWSEFPNLPYDRK